MAQLEIFIAGTSIGGVSYAHRILKETNFMPPNSTLVVTIGAGDKQHKVADKVREGVNDISRAVILGGGNFHVNVIIKKV